MKSPILARALLALSCLFIFATTVRAADLGGSCCSDLENRIAELEATTARKGNRKVTLTISGQINEQILWIDGDDRPTITGNALETSRVRFVGEAKLSTELRAGYVLELGVDTPTLLGNKTSIGVRHSFLYLDSATFGRVSLGQTSQSTDGIVEISVANTSSVSKAFNFNQLSIDAGFDGNRKNVIRYDTPALMGVTLSGSWSSDDESKDVAARYAGELLSFKVAAGIGYRETGDSKFTGGSISVIEAVSGIFVTGAYGRSQNAVITVFNFPLALGTDFDAAQVQAGVERNVFGFGKTTVFGEYAVYQIKGASSDLTMKGAGLVQSLDAGAIDLYAGWQQFSIDGSDDVNVFKTGAIIKF